MDGEHIPGLKKGNCLRLEPKRITVRGTRESGNWRWGLIHRGISVVHHYNLREVYRGLAIPIRVLGVSSLSPSDIEASQWDIGREVDRDVVQR